MIVAPLAGAWIEIEGIRSAGMILLVAPLAGAWIEIANRKKDIQQDSQVAPLAGAWIEILSNRKTKGNRPVAPLAGAWIEISCGKCPKYFDVKSLPSRERGLKSLSTVSQTMAVPSLPSRERGLKYQVDMQVIL